MVTITYKDSPSNPFNHLDYDGVVDDQYKGLTKREYFAAIAMQGLLAGHYEYFKGNADVSGPDEIAKYAVLNADSLIKELNKE